MTKVMPKFERLEASGAPIEVVSHTSWRSQERVMDRCPYALMNTYRFPDPPEYSDFISLCVREPNHADEHWAGLYTLGIAEPDQNLEPGVWFVWDESKHRLASRTTEEEQP